MMRSALIACLVLMSGTAWGQTLPPPASPGATARQLVIPFENATREGRLYWLTEASAVVLTDDLIALGAPAITRDDRLRAFERLHVPNVANLSEATIIRLGEIVGAGQVVLGSFEVTGDQMTVRARTIRLDVGRMSPEIVERGPLKEMFGIYARVARRIVPGSGVSTAEMEQGHPSLPAFELYIKGILAEAPATKIRFLAQAVRQAPSFQRGRLALWTVYDDEGEHHDALATIRAVPASSRLFRRAQFLGAISQLKLGDYQQAYDTLLELNRSMPDPALLNDLGIVQLRRPSGAPGGRATSFFTDATRLDATDPDLFFNLGYAYWLERDTQSAINWLREAVRRDTADGDAHYVLGVALQTAGSTAEAAREKELARRLSSKYAEWENRQPGANIVPRGLERLKTGLDVPAALRVENEVVAAGQRDQRDVANFHLEAGRRLYQSERDAEAIAELRRAVYLAPYQSEAHLLLGRLYLRDGRLTDAIDELKISIWSEDTNPARIALAEAYLANKDEAAARSEIQLVLKRDPMNTDARRVLDRIPPQ